MANAHESSPGGAPSYNTYCKPLFRRLRDRKAQVTDVGLVAQEMQLVWGLQLDDDMGGGAQKL